MKSEIADGVYDNTGTMHRELWHEGKVVAHATASLIMTKDIPDSLRSQYDFLNEPFGHYPDVPRLAAAIAFFKAAKKSFDAMNKEEK